MTPIDRIGERKVPEVDVTQARNADLERPEPWKWHGPIASILLRGSFCPGERYVCNTHNVLNGVFSSPWRISWGNFAYVLFGLIPGKGDFVGSGPRNTRTVAASG